MQHVFNIFSTNPNRIQVLSDRDGEQSSEGSIEMESESEALDGQGLEVSEGLFN